MLNLKFLPANLPILFEVEICTHILNSFFQENDDIPLDSYCRIEHVVSGSWLHAFPGKTESCLAV